jgi:hypothetical protein
VIWLWQSQLWKPPICLDLLAFAFGKLKKAQTNTSSQVLCTAALPEASFEDLSAQVSALRGTSFVRLSCLS